MTMASLAWLGYSIASSRVADYLLRGEVFELKLMLIDS